MHYLLISFFFLLNTPEVPGKCTNPSVENAVSQLTVELTSNYTSNCKVHIAILDFRSTDDKVSRFNQLIQNEMNLSLAKSVNFKVIEQFSINHLLDEMGWGLSQALSFKFYSNLNESIFNSTGSIADVFIYGVVSVDESNVTINGYLVPNGLAEKAIKAKVQIPIASIPDNMFE
ncbi:hypothetical protein CYCD_02410 [Tenuifilaceae bacterium CYCD]|nr:hypothetical protein CYCD_02410 [Tenuifilaceae bacterium CYCD]